MTLDLTNIEDQAKATLLWLEGVKPDNYSHVITLDGKEQFIAYYKQAGLSAEKLQGREYQVALTAAKLAEVRYTHEPGSMFRLPNGDTLIIPGGISDDQAVTITQKAILRHAQ